jgi:lipopolysaccharide exporter
MASDQIPTAPASSASINRKMAAGMAWMSLLRMAIKSLGLVSTIVLARLLVPADFGLVAMAMSVIAGLELFKAFNFDVVLISCWGSHSRWC